MSTIRGAFDKNAEFAFLRSFLENNVIKGA